MNGKWLGWGLVFLLVLAGCSGDESIEKLAGEISHSPPNKKVMVITPGSDWAVVEPYISPLGFEMVDTFDPLTGTPLLSDLTPYGAIYYVSDNTPNDPVLLGDVLADYMDAGGKIVIASYGHTTNWGIKDRFAIEGHSALAFGATNPNTSMSMGTVFYPGHSIMANVVTVSTTSQDNPGPASGSTVIANWANGTPMVAVSASDRAVGIALYTVGSGGSGDYPILVGNAIWYLLNN